MALEATKWCGGSHQMVIIQDPLIKAFDIIGEA